MTGKPTGTDETKPPARWWPVILGGVAAALVAAVAVWWWVWPSNLPSVPVPSADVPTTGLPLPDSGQQQDPGLLQIQAVRTILTAVGGIGALFGLGVVMRRQWSHERDSHYQQADADRRYQLELDNAARRHQLELDNAARSEHDATERRITELYMTAAEQLGHEKAPVRLAALYALDRLGQNHPRLRQVIANIWCAYLRQPFTPPTRIVTEDVEARGISHHLPPMDSTVDAYLAPLSGNPMTEETREQEYEVRATAQRLLQRHLADPRPFDERDDEPPPVMADGYWGLDRVDLTGATLVNVDFSDCRLPESVFTRAHFYGIALFVDAHFPDDAWFDRVQLHGGAAFGGAHFSRFARFGGAEFYDDASFDGARFHGEAEFGDVDFYGMVRYWEVEFNGGAFFGGSRFHAGAWFEGGHFRVNAYFVNTRFGGGAVFLGPQFDEDVDPDFCFATAVLVPAEPDHDAHIWPRGWTLLPVPDGEVEPGWGRLKPSVPDAE